MKHKKILGLISILVLLGVALVACAPEPETVTVVETVVVEKEVEGETVTVVETVVVEKEVETIVEVEVTAEPEAEAEAEAAPEAEAEAGANDDTIKIGFLAGVQDPFYFTMERGARQAAADFGAELIVQIPDEWNTTVQTPMLDAMVARGDLDFLFLAPTATEAMIAPLQNASDTGLPIITNDTFIGDGDYENGPVTFPISYIGSDNVLGGEIACHALAEAIGETGKVYIQNTVPGVSTTDQREEGCKAALEQYPDVELIGVDFNDDDPSKAQAQVEATLQRVPDLAGIFGTNVFSAQGAGTVVANQGLGDQVQVVAFDATELAIEQLRSGVVDLVIAQKPADMGYMAVAMAMAHLNGVGSIPVRIPTGYQIITADNVDDPEVAKFIYTK
jgi:ribose transport system substrate-binding protein